MKNHEAYGIMECTKSWYNFTPRTTQKILDIFGVWNETDTAVLFNIIFTSFIFLIFTGLFELMFLLSSHGFDFFQKQY